MPSLFVVLWSTGFIFAKLGMPATEPATFLALRFVIVIAALIPLMRMFRAAWPKDWRLVGHAAIVGVLLHIAYLGGVFAGIAHGVPAGVAALIVGVQPVLTATLVGPLLGERVKPVQWAGLAFGFVGLVLVLEEKLALGEGSLLGYALCAGALVGITVGTIWQKRYCTGIDLAAGAMIQHIAALAVVVVLALLFESMRVEWSGRFVLSLLWLALVLSIATWTLLMWLVRRGAAAKVASLFYLTPASAALIAWFLFGESFAALGLVGMALTVVGVALANR
ncbi:MAG: DMT family transporter [Rhodospirillaceae bacterium]|nr:DMT family transporter [Rhodospirillaceae bacterium]